MLKHILEKKFSIVQEYIDDEINRIVDHLVHKSEDVQEIKLLRLELEHLERMGSLLRQ
jgi:hypothetical protein